MAVSSITYSDKFIRTGGSVSFQERPAQPADFTMERGFGNYAALWADSGNTFFNFYPDWQSFADCFVMRRAVITITGTRKCLTASFGADELETHISPGFVSVRNFAVPGFDRGSIPKGEYQLRNMDFRDLGDTFTIINVSYIQYAAWELIQLEEVLPDPAGAVKDE